MGELGPSPEIRLKRSDLNRPINFRFWLGHEKDPLTVIAATIMLHWYNPDGPEHVSFDTSRFWIQIGAGLASQVGLHKEPSPGPEGVVRRRLWWTLVVSISNHTL